MEAWKLHLHLPFLCLALTIFLSLSLSSAFTPLDNYLLNCGSNSSATLDNRTFVPDSLSISSGQSISLSEPEPLRGSPAIYRSASVFTAPVTYKLPTRTNGTHLVRLHFSPFKSQDFDLSRAKFRVLVDGLMVLRGFSTEVDVVKEFVMSLGLGETELVFEPSGGSGFGFVSAIEVISAPSDLIVDFGVGLVGGKQIEPFNNLSASVLETLYRINVGGPKLTPPIDTLGRTWIPDDEFLVDKSAATNVVSNHTPNHEYVSASREIAPDNVYMTAKELNQHNVSMGDEFNVSWSFPVGLGGALHFVRLHFCDIVSTAADQLVFDVYINDLEAYTGLDLSSLSFEFLDSPVYVNYVANSDDAGTIRVSIKPTIWTSASISANAILNGVEIMRIVSLPGSVSSSKRKIWLVVASAVGGGVVLLLAVIALVLNLRKKNTTPMPRIGHISDGVS